MASRLLTAELDEGALRQASNFNASGTGGVGALVGGMLGRVGSVVGGSLSSNEASTMLPLTDNRSGLQLAAAEGSAKNWDFGAVGALFGGSAGGAGASARRRKARS